MQAKLLKVTEKIIEYGFYALAFLVPLVFTPATFELFEFPKMILVYLLTMLIVAAFLTKGVITGRLNLKRTPLDLPILLYATCYLLSTIFSLDRYTSIFGYYTRFNGGLLSLVCYIALYYVFVGEMGNRGDRRERFVRVLLLSSLLVSIYGILQHFGIDKDYWVQDVQRRVFSTLGQPNWLAAYLVMVLPVGLAAMLDKSKKQKVKSKNTIQNSKILFTSYYLLVTILYAAFWFTYSRSGLLGLAAALGTFLIFLGQENLRKNWQPLLLVGLSWALISVLTFSSKIAFAATPSATPSAQPQPPSGSTVDIRLAVWQGTLNLIKDHPLLGTGPETFAYSFLPYRPVELNQTAEWEFLYNKAHNEYLNIAACTGLLGLASYLFLISKFIFWNVRSRWTRNNILPAGIFAGWVGVLVTNFFGFSVVATSLLFWLFMALNVSPYQSVKVSKCQGTSESKKRVAPVVLSFFILYSSFFILNLFRADVSFNAGEKFSRYGSDEVAAEYYQKAVSLNPREPRYHRELASVLAKLGKVEEAVKEAEVAYNLNPKNSLTVRSLISTYVKLAEVGPQHLSRAEELIAEAVSRQPTNPQLYYEQALILLKDGKDEEAVAALQKAVELKPDYQKVKELLETFPQNPH